MAYNKLLNFVPATNSAASTGLPTLRQPDTNALCVNDYGLASNGSI